MREPLAEEPRRLAAPAAEGRIPARARDLAPDASPLHGREHELGLLDEQLDALQLGRGGEVIVEGPPGIGKTRLIDEALARAARRGVRVFRGAADPAGDSVPMAPLLEALAVGGDPVLEPGTGRQVAALGDGAFWLLHEIEQQLATASLRSPLVIAVDDAQWADDGTLLTLRALPRHLASYPILWIVGLRSPGTSSAASRLKRPEVRVLRLDRLDADAVARVAADVLGMPGDRDLLALAASVNGDPELAAELLRGLRDERLLRIHDGRAGLLIGQLPRRFAEAVDRRLLAVSAATRQAVELASVLGRRFSAEHLGLLLDQDPRTLMSTVDEAIGAGLLAARDDALAFRDTPVREVVSSRLPPSVREALRRRAVSFMVERDEWDADVAKLLLDVARPGDPKAVAALRRAAAELGPRSPALAVAAARRAIELMDAAPARALSAAGEAGLLLDAARLAIDTAPADAVRFCRRGLALPIAPSDRAALRAQLACALFATGEWSELSDTEDEAVGLHASAAAYARRDYSAALERSEQAGAAAPWRARLLGAVGRPNDAAVVADHGRRGARATSEVRRWHAARARAMLELGRLGDARADAEAVVAQGAGGPDEATARYVLARVALHTGDAAAVQAAAAAAADLRGHEPVADRRTGEWMAVLLADGAGERSRAVVLAAGTIDALPHESPTLAEPGGPCDLLDLLRIVLRAGKRGRAATVVAEAERRAHLNRELPLLAFVAAHARGLLDVDVEAVRASASSADAVPGAVARAAILEDAAGVVARRSRREAVARLDEALSLYAGCGATHDAARVRRRLRELGVRRRRTAAPARAMGWAALSTAELAVVELVAEGATNRQAAERLFLSPHTVSSHLRHTFEKLGISSRVDLARLYAERGRIA